MKFAKIKVCKSWLEATQPWRYGSCKVSQRLVQTIFSFITSAHYCIIDCIGYTRYWLVRILCAIPNCLEEEDEVTWVWTAVGIFFFKFFAVFPPHLLRGRGCITMNSTYKDLCTRCIKCKEYIERYDTQQHYSISSKKWQWNGSFKRLKILQIFLMYSLLNSRLMRFIFQRLYRVKSSNCLFHTIWTIVLL